MAWFDVVKEIVFGVVPSYEIELNLQNVLIAIGVAGLTWFELKMWSKHR